MLVVFINANITKKLEMQTILLTISILFTAPKKQPIINILDKIECTLAEDNIPGSIKVREYSYLAIRNQKIYGIPYSITMSQFLLESGISNKNPQGNILSQHHNYFGIKYWQPYYPFRLSLQVYDICVTGYVLAKDDCEELCAFMTYRSPYLAFKYHAMYLSYGDTRYKRSLQGYGYQDWLKSLQENGYASDLNYRIKLEHIIKKYYLYEIDDYLNKL